MHIGWHGTTQEGMQSPCRVDLPSLFVWGRLVRVSEMVILWGNLMMADK